MSYLLPMLHVSRDFHGRHVPPIVTESLFPVAYGDLFLKMIQICFAFNLLFPICLCALLNSKECPLDGCTAADVSGFVIDILQHFFYSFDIGSKYCMEAAIYGFF